MKRIFIAGGAFVGSVIAIGVVALLAAGCETGGGTVALTVSPSYVNLTSSGTNQVQTQTFSVTGGLRELSLPLEWSVSNPGLGYIAESGGDTASYVSTGRSGDNAVLVEDQYGAEGVATIRQ